MGNFERGGQGRDFGAPREMHKATCSECGKECQVPFKPSEGKPVYCRDCYAKRKKF
ncbi:MAG: CxxC-x17-CxxC domain-containing protein [Nanoarchaeota archaeon]